MKTFFRFGLYVAVFAVLFCASLSACGQITEKDIVPTEEKTENPVRTDRKYPGANDQMVYIPMEEPVLQQWSLSGEKKEDISLPVKKYGGDDYSLLWADDDELIWSVYTGSEDKWNDGRTHILSTPLKQSGTGEEVMLGETKKLFTLKDEDDIEIGGIGDSYEEAGIMYVDRDRILFFAGGDLYGYDRAGQKGPALLTSPDGEDHFGAVSAKMLGDQIIYHTGRTPGKVEEDAYEFWSYDPAAGTRKNIDNRCYADAAYVTDPVRGKVYYQIIDDRGIWEYDSATERKKELIPEKALKKCHEQNQLSWDDGYFDDLLYVEGDTLYYISNRKSPVVFSYSLADGTLIFEGGLTKECSRYLDDREIEKISVAGGRLLLYMHDESYDPYYLCVDLQTAEGKAVGPADPEQIYFGMLGEWYADDTGNITGGWEPGAEKESEDTAAAQGAETVEEQIELISSQSDMWLENNGSEVGLYCYAVTDLDHNGRLEVIASSGSQGSGGHTMSVYYQVSRDGTRLRRIHEEGGSTSDIVEEIKTAFVDPVTGTTYYCVYDYTSGGAGARYVWYGAMVLRDGLITNRTYAEGECTWNRKKTDEVWHYSYWRGGKEKKIRGSDIDSLASAFFDGFEKKKVSISWLYMDEGKTPSKKKLKRMLAKSYNGFSVR